jgi:FMN-dependent oxidoreductase (nitrilotriacetate monooxygenase family)
MSSAGRQLHLNYFHGHSGNHESAWRHPDAEPDGVLGIEYLVSLAQMCEAACLDSIFLPHGFTAQGIAHSDFGWMQDPVLALAAVAGFTKRIGLVCTMSTTFSQPFDLAQRFATLDHLSNGRAGWNMVTSTTDSEARNFGLAEIPEHDGRYRRAAEFVEVCKKLWDSWDDGARVIDKVNGVYADMAKVRAVDHVGEHYSVEGPLSLPRSPQRYPLLAQAGSSEAGKTFAAQYADAMFAITPTIDAGRALRAEMTERAARFGREPHEIAVMPGLATVIGPTETEARRRAAELAELVVPERGIGILEAYLKMDLRDVPLDGPVPELPPLESFSGGIARMQVVYAHVAKEKPTLRQLAGWFANQMRGHGMFVGTAEQLANRMEEWLLADACDGFLLLPPLVPRDIEDICRDVVPILQERGIFRSEYEGTSLREHYGVPVRETPVPAAS